MAELPEQAPVPAIPPPHPFSTPPSFAQAPRQGIRGRLDSILERVPRQTWLGLGVLAGVLIIGAIILLAYAANRGGILVKSAADQPLTIQLNGATTKPTKQGTDYFLRTYTGRYNVVVKRDGYEPYSQDITVGSKQTVVIRPIFSLLPPEGSADPIVSVDHVRADPANNKLFFVGDRKSGLYELPLATRIPRKISTKAMPGIYDIEWSKDPNVAIILANQGTFLQEIPTFDFQNQLTAQISGPEVESAAWDPNDQSRLAVSITRTNGEHSLIFTDKKLVKLDRKADLTGIENPHLTWSADSRVILLVSRSKDPNQNNIWKYTTADGTLSQVTTDGAWGGVEISPNGDKVIAEQDGKLYALSLSDGSKTDIKIVGNTRLIAWRDNDSFFVPDVGRNRLLLANLDGTRIELSFSFTNPHEIQGLLYFPEQKMIVFYTSRALYTLSVGV